MSFFTKAIRFFKYIKFWRDGGVAQLSISQIKYDQILEGKRIILTGGSSGIGLAMAKKFLMVGAKVLITGRDKERLSLVVEEINNPGLYAMQWDISNMDVLENHFDEAVALLGGCDIIVNNAAYIDYKKTDLYFYNKMMDTNMRAVYFLCKKAVEYFELANGNKGGKILNISSINSFESSTDPYYISKSGLNAITRGFAKEYAKKNIIVNAIAPGYCASSINYIDINKNAYNGRSANRRIVVPEEIAELATFMLSDSANGIIGQTIVCDGGALL